MKTRTFCKVKCASLMLSIAMAASCLAVTEKVDGTTGIPMGGVGTGALKFCPNSGSFQVAPNTPIQRGFGSMPNTCFQFYSNRGGTIATSTSLKSVLASGRYDDDAIYPVQYANFGVINNVAVNLTAFSAIDYASLDNMSYPYAFFEIQLSNGLATPVDVACALQLGTSVVPIGVAGKGIRTSGGVEYAVYAASPSSGALVTYGNDGGFLTSGQCNNSVAGTINKTAVKVALAGNETKTVRFVLSWYNGADPVFLDRYYYFNAGNNAGAFADLGLAKFASLQANALNLATKMRGSNLPEWLKNQTMNSLCNLSNNWVYTKDGRIGCAEGQWPYVGTMDQMWHARPAFLMLNPAMIWKELQYWARTQKLSPAGQIHHDFGINGGAPGWSMVTWDDQQHADYRAIDSWVDLNCGFIISVYEAFIATDDHAQMNYFWPYVKKAAQRILDQAAQYGSPAFPYTYNGSQSSYDAGGNSDCYNSGLAIVTYQIMSELSAIQGETALKATYDSVFATAKASYQARWLNEIANSFPYGRICESAMAGHHMANYLKFDQISPADRVDYGVSAMNEYYEPIFGLGAPAGTYEEWAEYMIPHLGGLLLQTGRVQEWRGLQYDYYRRSYLNRNKVFNTHLGILPEVVTPNYKATDFSGAGQYISYPDLWRNYYELIGYHRNKHTGELWVEPKLPLEMNHTLTNGMFISPEGFGAISYTESGAKYQNQSLTVSSESPISVSKLYLRDGFGTNITSVKVNGAAQSFTRVGTGYSRRVQINWSGTVGPTGISVVATGDAPANTPVLLKAVDLIEAENYNSSLGIIPQACTDNGAGIAVANVENGDYICFDAVDFETGFDALELRVASAGAGGSVEVRLDSITGKLVGTCAIASTGGWDTWSVDSCGISGATGVHKLFLKFTGGTGYLFNINWLKFARTTRPAMAFSAFGQIEAERCALMTGSMRIQNCTDTTDTSMVGYIANGNYMEFDNVNFGAGVDSATARVASTSSSGTLEYRLDSPTGTLIGTCPVASTGGWNSWATKSCAISGAAGTHKLFLVFTGGTGYLFNLNWVSFGKSGFSGPRIWTGSTQYSDSGSNLWKPDALYSTSANGYGYMVPGNMFGSIDPVSNTSDSALYQRSRYITAGNLQYRFALPNNTYAVTLKFAETYVTNVGGRTFDIAINGAVVTPAFDILAAAGGHDRAVDKTYNVTVSDGILDIELVRGVQNPTISAIQILP